MAPQILTLQQRSALESAYTFFSGAIPFFQSVHDRLRPDEKLVAANLCALSELAQRKLVEAFPDLLEWLREWESGGGAS